MINTKIKILLTTGIFPPEVGGPATYSALLEKELPQYGITVKVLPFRVVKNFPKIIRHFIFFTKVLWHGFDKDLLYTQDTVSVGFPTMLAAKILGKPFLVRVPGDYAWEQSTQRFGVEDGIDDFQKKRYGILVEILRKIQALTVKNADKAITPSKYFKNLVTQWNPGRNNVVVVYNGINFSEIPRNDFNFESKTLVSAGRLVSWKGFDSLIDTMEMLPNWKLSIAGNGPEAEELLKLIQDKNLENRVFLLGEIDRAKLIGIIQNSEIFILNTSFESFSFQVVEAMRAQTPIITTKVGNLSEIIDDGKEGFLVEPNNKEEILKAIQKLQDPDLRKSIISNAFLKSDNFSIKNTLDQTSKIIFDLIKNKKI